ncbi:MAG: peptidylprolyl isomerase [Fimbriimonas sp.]
MPNLAAFLVSLIATLQGPLPDSVLPKAPTPDKVVAKVNGVEIKASDVEALLWDWRGHEVTQDLITYQLILGEAKRLKVEVKPTEIERSFEERLAEYRKGVPPGSDLEESLRGQGFPKSRLYLRVHTDLLVNRIAMLDFRPDDYVRVSTSAYRPAPEKPQTPIQRAGAAHQRLVKGEPWLAIVKSSDLDEVAKEAAGHLGWRALAAFPETARPEIRALKSGGFTKPVALPDGSVQLFRVEMRGMEAKDDEARELQESFLARARQQLLQRLRSEAKIERPK